MIRLLRVASPTWQRHLRHELLTVKMRLHGYACEVASSDDEDVTSVAEPEGVAKVKQEDEAEGKAEAPPTAPCSLASGHSGGEGCCAGGGSCTDSGVQTASAPPGLRRALEQWASRAIDVAPLEPVRDGEETQPNGVEPYETARRPIRWHFEVRCWPCTVCHCFRSPRQLVCDTTHRARSSRPLTAPPRPHLHDAHPQAGMLWGSRLKWWGDGGERRSAHEGLDFQRFDDGSGGTRSLAVGSRVAPLLPGSNAPAGVEPPGPRATSRHAAAPSRRRH